MRRERDKMRRNEKKTLSKRRLIGRGDIYSRKEKQARSHERELENKTNAKEKYRK